MSALRQATWKRLSKRKLEEMATRYEAACLFAAYRCGLQKGDPEFAARLSEMRDGIWLGVAQELRDLGCTEENVPAELANIINFAVRRRALAGLPTKGRA